MARLISQQADPRLIEHARPLAGHGAAAARRLLGRVRPDALLIACDSQLGEITEVLRENNLQIPVIGCDGLPLPQFSAARRTVDAPRRFCGELLARNLLAAVDGGGAPQSQVLEAHFR